MTKVRDFLLDLCKYDFVSGYEHKNSEQLIKYFQNTTDSLVRDKLGSYIFTKNGSNSVKIMIDAHIDEIGLMITDISKNGFLSFVPIGGIYPITLVAQEVTIYGKEDVVGIIGTKPFQLEDKKESNQATKINQLYIDTGFTKEQLEKKIKIGDIATVNREPFMLKNNMLTARALDNKAGVAIMYETANQLQKLSHKSNIYFCASVQEEVGLRGAITTSNLINPDIAIIVDIGFGHTYGCDESLTIKAGKGPGVGIGSRFNYKLTQKFIDIAKESNFDIQYDISPNGSSTNTSSIQVSKEGVPCICLSIPVKYGHSSIETVHLKDLENIGLMIARFINQIDDMDLEDILCF